MQAALVEVAQSGDADAAITLLVQMRPGLVRLTRLVAACGGLLSDEAANEVRAAFFETLYSHSLERRPTKIAANLLLDTKSSLSKPGRSVRTVTGLPQEGPAQDGKGTGMAYLHPTTDIDHQSGIIAHQTLLAVVTALPGSAQSRQLTAELAFRAWVLRQPPGAIATDLNLGLQAVTSRLHRLRAAIRQDDSLWPSRQRSGGSQ